MKEKDTIAAISTAVGSSGIAIIRISGANSLNIINKIFKTNKTLTSHTMVYGTVCQENGEAVDEALVCFMEKPRTYTKEDVVEINCHGGIKPATSVLSLVLQQGARHAEPGEFTKRAFLNGRIDLSQAEAVMDVINSKTELSQKAALNQLKGSLKTEINSIRAEILELIANIEASIDYPEHEMEFMNLERVNKSAAEISEKLKKLINSENKGKIIKEGIDTAIIGSPNVGKSSLLNFLLDEERAIVTDIAGTTRDILQESVCIGDVLLKLTDTAGIRKTSDEIERIGVEKSRRIAENAELILFMAEAGKELSSEDIEVLEVIREKKKIILINKSDLVSGIDTKCFEKYASCDDIIFISVKEKTGIDKLYAKIKDIAYGGELEINNDIYINNLRHKISLERCYKSLKSAMDAIYCGMAEDFVSIDLQEAYNALGEITGETLDEDIVDKIFSNFCLGK